MSDRTTKPSILHVIVRAGATNSQYNEHCLPVLHERRITVASIFPADVKPPPQLRMVEGDGTARGGLRAIRTALELSTYDAVHVHAPASGMLTLLAYLRSRRSRRNLVFTVHNSWRNFRRRNRMFLYVILFCFPTVVMCGAAAYESLPRLLRWLAGPRVSVIPNGVDVDRVDRATREADPSIREDARFRVVSVNRLIPLKDPWTVLEAFERMRDPTAELDFVGDGPLREGLETGSRLSRARGRVRITGVVPRDDVYRLLSTANVFVSASGGEGLPVAVLEAMACGCPVILSDIPPHREIARVAPGVRLVKRGDVEGFAQALHQLRQLQPAERRELGRQQRECVAALFSVRGMNDAYRELYMQLTERNNGQGAGVPAPSGAPAPSGGDVAGLLTRMRARLGTCIVLTLLGAAAGFGYAQAQPPVYEAKASLIVGDTVGGPANQEELDASAALAATYADVIRREPVLEPVAQAGFADDWQNLVGRVHAQVGDKNPQLIQVTASAPRAWEAEDLANAIAERVVEMVQDQAENQRTEFVRSQLTRLEAEITDTQETIDRVSLDLNPEADPDTADEQTRQLRKLNEDLDDLNDRYFAMVTTASEFSEGAEVSVLEGAYTNRNPIRPDQKILAVAGAGVGLALAAGIAYIAGGRRSVGVGRDRPPAGGPPFPNFGAADLPPKRADGYLDGLAPEPSRPGGSR
jgi:glycosyltransferase involved in cell wall biosynthesis/capsular polysaccharide biosynthesis protein